jgi:hypothetical protein
LLGTFTDYHFYSIRRSTKTMEIKRMIKFVST